MRVRFLIEKKKRLRIAFSLFGGVFSLRTLFSVAIFISYLQLQR